MPALRFVLQDHPIDHFADQRIRERTPFQDGGAADYLETTYGYDAAGNRIRSTNAKGEATEYFYDPRGHLIRTHLPESTNQARIQHYTVARYNIYGHKIAEGNGLGDSQTWTYDASGRMINHNATLKLWEKEFDLAGREATYVGYQSGTTTQTDYRVSTYDKNGALIEQINYQPGQITPTLKKTDVSFRYDVAGNLQHYTARQYRSNGTSIDVTQDYDYEYLERDRYLEQNIQGRWVNRKGKSGSGTSTSEYDANGNLKRSVDAVDGIEQNYTTTSLGQTLSKRTHKAGAYQETDHFLYANGSAVGSYTVKADGGLNADFSTTYAPISERYPAATPSGYTVNDGDTLQSVALAVFGDAHLWYLIADANGLGADEALTPGQLLKIPNTVANVHATAQTYSAFDPKEVFSNTTPTLSVPKPSKPDACKKAIVVIVAVVVTAVVTYFLGPEAGYTSFNWIVAGALGAAAGSLAGQIAANAVGLQKGINWKHVAISAVAGAVGAGVGGGPVMQAVASNVAAQGMAMMLGEQERFDWRSVAVSAVAAGVTSGIDADAQQSQMSTTTTSSGAQLSTFAVKFAAGTVKAGLTQGLRIAVYGRGKMDWANIAADAFGSTIGSSIVANMQDSASRKQAWSDMVNQNQERYVDEPGIAYLPGADAYDPSSARYRLRSPEANPFGDVDGSILTREIGAGGYGSNEPFVGPPEPYEVKRGDSLYRIAARELGDSSLWPLIADANGISDPAYIAAGRRLLIPGTDGVNIGRVRQREGQYYAGLAEGQRNSLEAAAQMSTFVSETRLRERGYLDYYYSVQPPELSNPASLYPEMEHQARVFDPFTPKSVQDHLSDTARNFFLGGDAVAERRYQHEEWMYLNGYSDTPALDPSLSGIGIFGDAATGGIGGILAKGGIGIAATLGRNTVAKSEFRPFRSEVALDYQTTTRNVGDTAFIQISSDQQVQGGKIVGRGSLDSSFIELKFNNTEGDLFVNYMTASEPRHGIGAEMLSRGVEYVGPKNVRSISGVMDETNLDVYTLYREEFGLSVSDAIMQTPAAKIRTQLGYGNIQYDPATRTIRGYRK